MNHIAAFLGSLLFGFIRVKIEKQQSDDTGKRINWKKYFEKEWDDALFSVVTGQILVYFQRPMFFAYTNWQEWEQTKAESFYSSGEQAIAGCLGLFGSLLILLLFKYVVDKANKMSEK